MHNVGDKSKAGQSDYVSVASCVTANPILSVRITEERTQPRDHLRTQWLEPEPSSRFAPKTGGRWWNGITIALRCSEIVMVLAYCEKV